MKRKRGVIRARVECDVADVVLGCGGQAFDPVSGGPQQCIDMESWPRMERMTETFGATVGRALLESFYATASTEGLSVIFNRLVSKAYVQSMLRQKMPWHVLTQQNTARALFCFHL